MSSTDFVGPKASRRSSRTTHLLALFFAPWMFDYKAPTGDKAAIFLQTAALAISVIAFALSAGSIKPMNAARRLLLVCAGVAWFAIGSTVVGELKGQDTVELLAADVPLFLLIISAILTQRIFSIEAPEILMRTIIKILIGGIIIRFALAFTLFGLDMESVRYQVLSPGVIMSSAITVTALISSFNVSNLALSILNITVIAISVTRTQIVVIVGMVAAVFIFSPQIMLRKSILKKVGVATTVVIVGLVSVLASENIVAQRWGERLDVASEFGFDITAATRRAEVNYQIEELSSSFSTAAFGNGLRAENRLTGLYAAMIRETPGYRQEADLVDIGYGHNIYSGVIYTGGAAFGGIMLAALLYILFRSLKNIRAYALSTRIDRFAAVHMVGALTVIGMSYFGLLGGTLGDRGTALWFGAAIGMIFSTRPNSTRQAPQVSESTVTTHVIEASGR